MHSKLPPVIAVIGSDGSGKSTVCEHLIDHVQKYGPAVRVHLGKQAGNVERAVVKLPFLGKSLNKAIKHNKVKATKHLPGPIPGLVVMSFVYRRLRRFRHMLALRKQGMIILADRYPQVQLPGGYDGPVFPVNAPGSAFVKWLAGREMKAFQWMASQKPDLVIKLNVDLDVACARKPDHRPEALALKVAVTPQLTFEGSQVVNVDANKPLDDVILHAQQAVSAFMEAQGYRLADTGEAVASH